MESVEKQKQLSHSFHRPLEISQTARDSHIPPARLHGHGKVENQKQVSHFPTAARDNDCCSLPLNTKTKERKSAARGLLILFLPSALRRKPLSCSFFDWKMLLSWSGL
jgi:hypothetical protein